MISRLTIQDAPPEAPHMPLDLLPHTPPQDLAAESAVLGCMLLFPEAAADCAAQLQPADFYRALHGETFALLRDMVAAGTPIDWITVRAEMQRLGAEERLGGVKALIDHSDGVPSAENVSVYVRRVREAARLRAVISAASAIVRDCYEPGIDLSSVLDKAQADLMDVLERAESRSTRARLWQLVDAEMARLRAHEVMQAESTGWESLDAGLGGGLRAGELILLAARPSVGKTSFATAIARNVASRRVPVAFFSLEMPGSAIAQNLIAQEARTNTFRIRSARLGDREIDSIEHQCQALRAYPIDLIESTDMNMFEIASEARRAKMRDGLGLIVLDYLQLVESGGTGRADNRNLEVGQISRALKRLSMRLRVPVVALSQMSRDQEKGGRSRPMLSDLRDSGSLEQDADVVLFLVRQGYQKADDTSNGRTEVIVAKNRNGPTGEVSMQFHKESVSFTEWRGP